LTVKFCANGKQPGPRAQGGLMTRATYYAISLMHMVLLEL